MQGSFGWMAWCKLYGRLEQRVAERIGCTKEWNTRTMYRMRRTPPHSTMQAQLVATYVEWSCACLHRMTTHSRPLPSLECRLRTELTTHHTDGARCSSASCRLRSAALSTAQPCFWNTTTRQIDSVESHQTAAQVPREENNLIARLVRRSWHCRFPKCRHRHL